MPMIEVTRMQCTKCEKSWNERHEMIGTASIHMNVDAQDAILPALWTRSRLRR